LREPLGPSLLQAAPIYRRHFWPADDRANRFWIGYASAMVRDAGDELAGAHARAYGVAWPEAVRVDTAAYAVPFGAYTMMGRLAGVHETVATRVPDLWHAILFATSSELTRRVLRNRGVADYKPTVYGMYERAWPQYREPIEKYWIAYLDDRMTFDAAIGQIVEASTRPR